MIEIARYITRAGKDVIGEWLSGLRDERASAKIRARINRLATGNFGDCRAVRQGVYELKVDWGPGYRVYYATTGKTSVLLLVGGDKRTQTSDIARAIENWKDYKRRIAP